MSTDTAARDWLATAPARLAGIIKRRMTWHHHVAWEHPEYFGDDDDRQTTTDLAEVEAVSSLEPGYAEYPNPENRFHALAVDVDVRAWLIPSSTEGHGHLYADLHIPEPALWAWLDASVEIGLIEPGYASACKSRGMTSLRAPWIRKGEEPSTLRENERRDAAMLTMERDVLDEGPF